MTRRDLLKGLPTALACGLLPKLEKFKKKDLEEVEIKIYYSLMFKDHWFVGFRCSETMKLRLGKAFLSGNIKEDKFDNLPIVIARLTVSSSAADSYYNPDNGFYIESEEILKIDHFWQWNKWTNTPANLTISQTIK